jgi:hypothetical protein
MIWDVVGFSHRQATTYQSLQMPSGHRPIELDIPIGPRLERDVG